MQTDKARPERLADSVLVVAGLFVRLASIILGAMSIIYLAIAGYQIEIANWLSSLLDPAQQIIVSLSRPLGDALLLAARSLLQNFSITLDLNLWEQWSYVYIILQLYFGRDFSQFLQQNYRNMAVASAVTGIPVSLAAGFLAGLAAGTEVPPASSMLPGFIPIAGFFVYACIMAICLTVFDRANVSVREGKISNTDSLDREKLDRLVPFWDFMNLRLSWALRRSIAGCAIYAASYQLLPLEQPMLAALMICWIALAIFWFYRGVDNMKKERRSKNISWLQAAQKTGNIQMSLDMLSMTGLSVLTLAIGLATA